jgi:hypothetical protein
MPQRLESEVTAEDDSSGLEAEIQRLADLCQRVAESFPSDPEARQELAKELSSKTPLFQGFGGSAWMDALAAEARRRAQEVLAAEAAITAFPRIVSELRQQLLTLERVSKRKRTPGDSAMVMPRSR